MSCQILSIPGNRNTYITKISPPYPPNTPRYPQNYPKISPQYSPDIPKISPRSPQEVPKMLVWSGSKVSPGQNVAPTNNHQYQRTTIITDFQSDKFPRTKYVLGRFVAGRAPNQPTKVSTNKSVRSIAPQPRAWFIFLGTHKVVFF